MNRDKGTEYTAHMAGELLEIIRKLTAELHPGETFAQTITLDTALDRDLGLDSLTRIQLLVRIERYCGVSLPERVFADAESPRDLLRAVLGADTAGTPGEAAAVAPLELGATEGVPSGAETLVDMLEWHVKAHPDRPHIRLYNDEDEGDIITYRKLWDRAKAIARGLQNRGLEPGEPVSIMLPTGPEYFYTFFGVLLAGGVPAPIYPPASRKRIEEHLHRHRTILSNCAAVSLITMPEAKTFAQLLKSQVTTLRSVTTPEDLSKESGEYPKGRECFASSRRPSASGEGLPVPNESADAGLPSLGGRNMAFLQYTSGSTGNPKGVILTHANLLANIRAMSEAMQLTADDVCVSWLPLYHDMGLIGAWLSSLYNAMMLVIMSPLSFLTRPQRWLWAFHRHRGTISAAPNFAYELCMQRLNDADLKGLDLSSWRGALNGAEPVSAGTLERFCERFAEYGFRRQAMMPVYGLAECSVGLAFPPMGRPPVIDSIERESFVRDEKAVPVTERYREGMPPQRSLGKRPGDSAAEVLRIVACGRPLRGHEIRVVNSGGRELPERQVGRLQFRGPSASSGYFHNPEATKALFDGDWLDSGDLAYLAGGDVYVTGRVKDVIIRAGRNIYPQELEEAVGDIQGIRKGSVAVFGSNDPKSGTERLVVIAETRRKDPATSAKLRAGIIALAMDLLGAPPDDVVLAPPGSVLKTSSGKIRRAASRQSYERGEIGKRLPSAARQMARLALAGAVPELRRAGRAVTAGLYAAYAWILLSSCFILIWTAVLLLPRFSWRWSFMHRMTRLMARALRIPFSVEGLEHVPPEGACVIVSNHASYIDSFVMAGALPKPVSFVAKSELAGHFALGPFLRRLRAEFVERFDRQKGVDDARRLEHTAHKGRALLFFPEGTFVRMPGLLAFHMGAFTTAAQAGLPVVPVAIRGTRSILRADSWFPRRGAITVTIGEPIAPGQILKDGSPPVKGKDDADPWKTALKLRDATRRHILRYCGEPDLSREKSPV